MSHTIRQVFSVFQVVDDKGNATLLHPEYNIDARSFICGSDNYCGADGGNESVGMGRTKREAADDWLELNIDTLELSL